MTPPRTAAFTVLYTAAVFIGRMDLIGGTELGLIWPAAGVGAVWLLAQRHVRSRWLDVSVLAAITLTGNLVTGADLPLSAALTAANVAQLLVFLAVFTRSCPQVWNAPGWGAFERVQHLWGLLAAALAGAGVGAFISLAALEASDGPASAVSAAVWLTRNGVSILVITALGLRLGRLSERRPGVLTRPAVARQAVRERLSHTPDRRIAEFCALVAASAAAYIATFWILRDLPLTFLLMSMTVWTAVRFGATFTALHALITGTAAVAFTAYGGGPFAAIGSPTTRVLVAQVFVGMVAVIGLALALGRDERETLFRQRAAAEQELGAQAGMLAAIVEAMHDGLVVVDADGRVVMSNPAARRLLGAGATPLTSVPVSFEAYRLLHPDGTPLSERRQPHMLALSGHEVRDMDVLACPLDGRQEHLLSVSATRLPAHDRAVVVVFHDVTAERRQRDELTAFAGIVAHDLRNPLSTVSAWAQLLTDALDAGPAGEATGELADGIARIQRAAAQMQELIDDLLAHATARDAPLALEPVALESAVRQVAAARGDLPHGPGPVFDIGPLDAVRADAALLRQLLDNLVGNAIKYTAPDQRPRITVTSALERPGWVRVEIADRGIGIPPGRHQMIFENFRRAHTGGPYTGSGLGLAICKRIVERHGGTIRAEDNPGGGSRFIFTLPAAGAPAPDRTGESARATTQDSRPRTSRRAGDT
ncbi:signal transduction histidine kinase [Planomonospora sphaerica]|uniref:Sensor-like histidine kinase SenX3 n=1 Tax=Planomonospora sphaerica TaxID=161355 RepID=A0A171DL05_9ACTN|nr:ATP-binding protein [Planomonospora sphaerica]GAT69500.1 signal transduction histidine kinase [Planomonospora sphaerica]